MKTATVLGNLALLALTPAALACDSCYGPTNHIEHVRHVKRIQPGAPNATYGPTRPLEWGQFNVLHTTDTHGWLEGHLVEQNYGADWGDFVSFATHLRHQAGNMGVDLLLIDTGDLHDGTGLSDTTTPDGAVSNVVFDQLNIDLLTIGNHELYLADVAYLTFQNFSRYWGDSYLTSNVQILNPTNNEWEYIGKTYKYFITAHGIRIMAFGVLYDFTGNTNVSKVIPAATMVKEAWFVEAVHTFLPIDMFLVLGHNPARPSVYGSTFGTIFQAIRSVRPNTPIQFFGGHTHIRDFAVLDESSTSLESGRYCETLGWFSMSGFDWTNSGYWGVQNPHGVPNPTRKATNDSKSPFTYSRRYMDWNRYTFEYHAIGSQNDAEFDLHSGLRVSNLITADRKELNLGQVYGCAPATYCQDCAPYNSEFSIYTILSQALGEVVINPARGNKTRMIFTNTGGVRFDLHQGPFTYDDNFIVSPFTDVFMYLPDVPYDLAVNVLSGLNAGGASKRWASMPASGEVCLDPSMVSRSALETRGEVVHPVITRRQVVNETQGYTTTDDFGTDGDDTLHTPIPYYDIPEYFTGNGTWPASGVPDVVDLIFIDYIQDYVLPILGSNYTDSMVQYYISPNFTTQDYLLPWVQKNWQANINDCPLASS